MKRGFAATSGLMLVIAAAGGGAAQAQAPAQPAIAGTQLSIVADGVVSAAPDLVTVSAGVTKQAGTAGAALAADREAMAAVIAALRRAGVDERDIQTNRIALNPQMRGEDNAPPTIVGYEARNQVSVRFRDVGKAGAIIDALVAAGANDISGPDFGYADPDAGLDGARTRAIATARARAELYARAAGLRVGRIVSIEERGVSEPGPIPMVMMMRKAASTPVMAGETERRVSVAVVFELD